ncbi:MAG: glycine zipper 2TM domain-containing protein [Allosphingosinicella sp.]
MKTRLLILALATAATVAVPAYGQTRAEEDRWRAAQRRFDSERTLYDRERNLYEQATRRGQRYRDDYRLDYDDDRNDNADYRTDYDAARYYRDDPRYQERVLTAEDEVYRGSDGQYYCRRSDGTTGLIIGGGAGALIGGAIDGGSSSTAGILVGGVLGALLGRQVERSQDIRCR